MGAIVGDYLHETKLTNDLRPSEREIFLQEAGTCFQDLNSISIY